MSATKEVMEFPSPKQWGALVPMERFEIACDLVREARNRRHPGLATRSAWPSPNEQVALNMLTASLRDLGYVFAPRDPDFFEWRLLKADA